MYMSEKMARRQSKDLKIGDEIEVELEYGKIVRALAASTIKTSAAL